MPWSRRRSPRRAAARDRDTRCRRPGIHKIKHVVVIMQENRSFDSYFGTYPGADGIPMQHGVPTVCVADPRGRPCVKPYPDHHDVNGGGPHGAAAAVADIDGGRMDGFVARSAEKGRATAMPDDPVVRAPARSAVDVMGYHTRRDIPNYWTYAQRLRACRTTCSSRTRRGACPRTCSWSRPGRRSALATTTRARVATLCRRRGSGPRIADPLHPSHVPRADLRLDRPHLSSAQEQRQSWGYYVVPGTEPDCENPTTISLRAGSRRTRRTPGIWNPLPYFDTVQQRRPAGQHPVDVHQFYTAAKSGTLPQRVRGSCRRTRSVSIRRRASVSASRT